MAGGRWPPSYVRTPHLPRSFLPLTACPSPPYPPPRTPQTRKLRALQRATQLFDRIATLPRQGKISEVELRLFLAGQGLGSNDVTKVRARGRGPRACACACCVVQWQPGTGWAGGGSPGACAPPALLHVHAQVVNLMKNMVRTDKFDFVTFWDFVTSYDWIVKAMRTYSVPI